MAALKVLMAGGCYTYCNEGNFSFDMNHKLYPVHAFDD